MDRETEVSTLRRGLHGVAFALQINLSNFVALLDPLLGLVVKAPAVGYSLGVYALTLDASVYAFTLDANPGVESLTTFWHLMSGILWLQVPSARQRCLVLELHRLVLFGIPGGTRDPTYYLLRCAYRYLCVSISDTTSYMATWWRGSATLYGMADNFITLPC